MFCIRVICTRTPNAVVFGSFLGAHVCMRVLGYLSVVKRSRELKRLLLLLLLLLFLLLLLPLLLVLVLRLRVLLVLLLLALLPLLLLLLLNCYVLRTATVLFRQAGFVRGYEALCDQQQVRLRKRPEFSELESVGVAEGLADPSIVLR